MSNDFTPATVVGLGAMGSALAAQLVAAGHCSTVWNRTPGKAAALIARGATEAPTVEAAIAASPVVITCLLDHPSVHDVLDSVAPLLRGRALINVTTTSPNQARELAAWAAGHGIDYLDGGIMAVPEMIGGPGSTVLYSGSVTVFEQHDPLLRHWGEATYLGPDAGLASLYDLAMLAGMYLMIAGFLHGAAMVATDGVSATEFAARATPFLAAMTGAFAEFATIIDGRDYAGEAQQSLEFSDLSNLVTASLDQGVNVEVLVPVQALIKRQIQAGHGKEGLARIYEELRSDRR
jgi:3-hydroxyisobutyrate dehydrogenase-like beta-hydroxyacid dehydrogenase